MKFSDNYSDLSRQGGLDAGFQFQFHCERCRDTWRTDFVPYRSGQASGWISQASGIFGGVLGNLGRAADGVAQAGWSRARDEAFREAIEQAKGHFHRCARCFQYVCDTCWTSGKGLCLNCAPSTGVEIEAARAAAEADAAIELARAQGAESAKKFDMKRGDRQLVCPKCGAETSGAKFCPGCGNKLAVKTACPECSAEVPSGARFCPECGHKA